VLPKSTECYQKTSTFLQHTRLQKFSLEIICPSVVRDGSITGIKQRSDLSRLLRVGGFQFDVWRTKMIDDDSNATGVRCTTRNVGFVIQFFFIFIFLKFLPCQFFFLVVCTSFACSRLQSFCFNKNVAAFGESAQWVSEIHFRLSASKFPIRFCFANLFSSRTCKHFKFHTYNFHRRECLGWTAKFRYSSAFDDSIYIV